MPLVLKIFKESEEVIPTAKMAKQAKRLNEGPTIALYRDVNKLRMHTRDGFLPYIWHNQKWLKINFPIGLKHLVYNTNKCLESMAGLVK